MREVRGDDEGHEREVGEEHRPLEFFGADDIKGEVLRIHRGGAVIQLPRSPGETVPVEDQVGRDRVPEREPPQHERRGTEQDDEVEQEVRQEGGHVSGSS